MSSTLSIDIVVHFKYRYSLLFWNIDNNTGYYRESPESMNFLPYWNRTIAKIVLSGVWFSTEIMIYDFWMFKVLCFAHFHQLSPNLVLKHKKRFSSLQSGKEEFILFNTISNCTRLGIALSETVQNKNPLYILSLEI